MTWIDVLEKISKTSKSSEKEILVKKYGKLLKPIFIAALGDDVYHVTSKKVKVTSSSKYKENNLKGFLKVLNKLKERVVTGNTAVQFITSFLEKVSKSEQEWMLRILDKKLRLGVSLKTIGKALGDNYVKDIRYRLFECMLATPQRDINPSKRYIAEPKIDGERISLIYDNIKGEELTYALSRGNVNYKYLFASYLKLLPKIAKKMDAKFMVIDGEAIARDGTWNSTQSLLSKGIGPLGEALESPEAFEKRLNDLRFIVFDSILDKRNSARLRTRRAWTRVIVPEFNTPYVKVMPSVHIRTIKDILRVRDLCCLYGFEGIVVKDLDSPYAEGERTVYWIKFKVEDETRDVIILEVIRGRGRNKNRTGALICRDPKTNEIFKVGSFKDGVREIFWKWRKKLKHMDLFIEIKNQPGDEAKSRFPGYVRPRFDKTRKETFFREEYMK
jgi:DNA ligase-1